jgi:lysophospholipase L1-like esterase
MAALALFAATLSGLPSNSSAFVRTEDYAVASWAAAVVPAAPADANRINNQTVRNVIHLSVGGDKVRVKLSNRYGTAARLLAGASVAIRSGDESIVPGTSRMLTFGGLPASSFTIPIGAELVSDWVDLRVADQQDLAVDIYLATDTSASTSPVTLHNARPAGQILSYLATGDQLGVPTLPTEATRTHWYFLAGVDVAAPKAVGAIVAVGDSIPDGSQSTLYATERWPDFLARRTIAGEQGIRPMGVPNLGIGGNRVLNGGAGEPALTRFDRDALVQTGSGYIIVLEGINDISGGATAAAIIQGHRQLIKRAHARGLKIYGGTVTPFFNAIAINPQREVERQALNDWIRNSGAYDAVIDFEAAVRDPANPLRMLPQYDSGDSLHPNSAGYEAMANAIDLNLFKP